MYERKHTGDARRFVGLTALILCSLTGPLGAQILSRSKKSDSAPPPANHPVIVARVNGVEITRDQLAEECITRHGSEVLDALVNRMIVDQACRNKGIVITAEDIDREVARMAQKFHISPKQWLEAMQKDRHITPAQYTRDIVWPTLALRKLTEGKVAVSEEDLKKAFETTYGEKVRCRLVMVEKQQMARELWEKVKKSHCDLKVFEDVAKNYSIDESSRSLGGQIQPIGRFADPQQLADEAFRLKPGELSSIVEVTKGAWVFLYCEGRVPAETKKLDEVREQLYDFIYDQRLRLAISETFLNLQKQAHTENLLTGEVNLTPAEAATAQQDLQSQPASARAPAQTQNPKNPGARPVGN